MLTTENVVVLREQVCMLCSQNLCHLFVLESHLTPTIWLWFLHYCSDQLGKCI